jgi:hypothetical protein
MSDEKFPAGRLGQVNLIKGQALSQQYPQFSGLKGQIILTQWQRLGR